jgi:hypothetical protein
VPISTWQPLRDTHHRLLISFFLAAARLALPQLRGGVSLSVMPVFQRATTVVNIRPYGDS